jgi:hypothetical protein
MSRIKCQPGCACKKHDRPSGEKTCPAGCACKKHVRRGRIDWGDPEAVRAYAREDARARRSADPEPSREAARKWAAKNPGYRLAYNYGISPERWDEMLAAQANCCYLCGEPLNTDRIGRHGGWIHVDHDHSCCRGQKSCGTCIRGLACFSCNVGIAKFGESPDRMRRVADSLEMANRRLREIPRLQGELSELTTRGSDTAGRPGE